MTTAAEIFSGRRCDGELCPSRNPWPLHHVGHRNNFRRLCTSCVLRHHRGFFCSACLEVLDSPPPPSGDADLAGIARCLRCSAAAHSSCLPDASASNYLCSVCDCQDPEGFSYFAVGDNKIDAAGAKALLSASRIAAASMSRAAAAARAEAERKMKLAAAARKMAKEMLERVVLASKRRKEEMEEEGKGRMKGNSASEKNNGALKVMMMKKKKKKKKKKMAALSSPSGLIKKF